ncbi:MAG TPA: endo alpha-1,4 polygalactosaminidase [Polyangiaceae bacterium]|jgi:hypothetical protein
MVSPARAKRLKALAYFLISFALSTLGRTASAASVTTAFFYGHPVPPTLFAHYDRVVVDPDALASPPSGPGLRAQALAYVAVGEVAHTRSWYAQVDRRWMLGQNAAWQSDVIDQTRPEWRAFLLTQVFDPLWKRGYRGFFLDALDSYDGVIKDPAARRAQADGLATTIQAIAARYPGAALVLNRGFDVLDRVAPVIAGIAAESLYGGWNPTLRAYQDVSPQDRAWLEARLRDARDRLHLPVTSIDYAPADPPTRRREIARRIAADGFDPWVTNPELDDLGVGQVEVVPRRILIVWDRALEDLATNFAHLMVDTILDQLGYAADYAQVGPDLPEGKLKNLYAGVVAVVQQAPDSGQWRTWIKHRLAEKLPIAFLDGLGFEPDDELLHTLGLKPIERGRPTRIVLRAPWMGMETRVPERSLTESPAWVLAEPATSESFLRVADDAGVASDVVFSTRWGGVALDPYVVSSAASGQWRWVLDPFAFFTKALKLPDLPLVDVTTENGRRVLTAHIDGDGFASRAEMRGTPYAAQAVCDQILLRHWIPTTVSVVEGEIGAHGVSPGESPKLEAVARRIFALPNVELASHGFAHPFFWQRLQRGETGPDGHPLHLPIPGLKFDLRREIEGSVAYINERLAPPGKRVKVYLWSGDALPGRRAVQLTSGLGIPNVNGVGSTRTHDNDSIAMTTPIGLPLGDGAVQIYAPVQNDNVFTNKWTGPFYGFRRAIETFQLEDSPRRTKPISIYYHFFSGSKVASLRALDEVYTWAETQETTPLFVSEYAVRADGFERASLARRLDGAWVLAGHREVRTLRISNEAGWPDLRRSQGVAGIRELPQGRYVHLAPGEEIVLALAPTPPATPYLEQANAVLSTWRLDPATGRVAFALRGHVPVKATIRTPPNVRRCTMHLPGGRDAGGTRRADGVFDFALDEKETGDAQLSCE